MGVRRPRCIRSQRAETLRRLGFLCGLDCTAPRSADRCFFSVRTQVPALYLLQRVQAKKVPLPLPGYAGAYQLYQNLFKMLGSQDGRR
jgi:hypothetical protein